MLYRNLRHKRQRCSWSLSFRVQSLELSKTKLKRLADCVYDFPWPESMNRWLWIFSGRRKNNFGTGSTHEESTSSRFRRRTRVYETFSHKTITYAIAFQLRRKAYYVDCIPHWSRLWLTWSRYDKMISYFDVQCRIRTRFALRVTMAVSLRWSATRQHQFIT